MPDSIAVTSQPERFLRTAAVCALFGGIAPETLWRWVKAGWFPKPIRLHPTSRINVWRASEILALIASDQRGLSKRPEAALAERGRRIKERKALAAKARAAASPKTSPERNSDGPKPNRFIRQAP